MKNKTILITGANSGIGFQTALNLAKMGSKVIMCARNSEKGRIAVEEVRRKSGNDQVQLQLLDLADLASIRIAADEILERHERIDVLMNNAGLIKLEWSGTKDGFETQFGVNHLGHFLLTNLLLPKIQETAAAQGEARIICVSSNMHRRYKGIHFDDLMWKNKKYSGTAVYGQSKLANILMANEIARRYGDSGIIAHSLHPGVPRSNIYRNGNITGYKAVVTKLVYALIGTSLEKGGEGTTKLACDPEVSKSNGQYWDITKLSKANLPPNEPEVAARLWDVSKELVGL